MGKLIPCDFMVKRMSVLSNSSDDHYLNDMKSNSIFQEMILVTNYELYKHAFILKQDNLQMKDTLNNYINRAMYRTTPLGLFSSVGISFENPDISNEVIYKKHVSVDYEWLINSIKKLESRDYILENLKIIADSSTVLSGGRFLQLLPGLKKHSSKFYKTLKYNSLIERIMLIAKKPIYYNDLIYNLCSDFRSLNSDFLSQFVKKLIMQGFLVSELSPTLSSGNNLKNLIDKLENISEAQNEYYYFKKLHTKILEYEQTELGKGIDVFIDILKMMDTMDECKNKLKVDLSMNDSPCPDKSIIKNVTQFANFLSDISVKVDMNTEYLQDFKHYFKERYGLNASIPLKELFANPALSNRYLNRNYSVSKFYEKNKDLITILKDKIMYAISNKDHITIDESDFENVQKRSQSLYLNDELELYFKILDSGYISLTPASGTDRVGKSFDRFKYINFKQENILYTHENENEYYIVRENKANKTLLNLIDNTLDDKLLNIPAHPSIKNQVNLDDIMVALVQKDGIDYFVFINSITNKLIDFYETSNLNLHNENNYSDIVYFILKATAEKYRQNLSFLNLLDIVTDIPYTPSIFYKNILIKQKKWILKRTFFSKLNFQALEDWFEKWDVIERILLQEFDTFIYVNLSIPKDKKLLFNYIIKNIQHKDIVLLSADEYIQYDKLNQEEYIISFTSKNRISEKESLYQFDIEPFKKDFYVLGDEWIYIKFYGIMYDIKHFISNYLYYIFKYMNKSGFVSDIFYLVYFDSDEHVRLRIKVKNKNIYYRVIDFLNKVSREWIENQIIEKIEYSTYEREVNRYGGIDRIEKAEAIFTEDSRRCLEILKKNRLSEKDILISIIDLLSYIDIDLYSLSTYLSNRFSYKMYRKKYKKIRGDGSTFIRFVKDNIINKFNLNSDNDVKILKTHVQFKISLSIIHMHCNRLLLDSQQEETMMYLLTYLFEDVIYILRYKRDLLV